jgi:hypothetical protein
MKKQTAFFALAFLSLLLSGFVGAHPSPKADDRTLTFRVTTAVRSDGSGTVKVEFVLSPDLVDYLDSEGIPKNQFCNVLKASVSTEFQFTTANKNGGYQCIGTTSFQDLGELENLMEKNLGDNTVQRLEIEDKRFHYEALIYIDTSYLSSSDYAIEIFWMLVLPGTPGENNADTVSGRTLTWDLSNARGSTLLSAESALGGGFLGMDSSMLAIVMVLMMSCCCVILLIAAGIAAFLVIKKKNPPAAEESSAENIIPGS